MERGVCDICVARACADARHTNDTHACPQTTLFVMSTSRPIASSARHLVVTEKKTYPPFRSPPFESARFNVLFFLTFWALLKLLVVTVPHRPDSSSQRFEDQESTLHTLGQVCPTPNSFTRLLTITNMRKLLVLVGPLLRREDQLRFSAPRTPVAR